MRKIAARRELPINALVAEIDEAREMDTGLASAIRVYILSDLRAQVAKRD